jgi:type I site-specific restriction endonuclease
MKIAQDSASSAETKKQAIKDAKDVMRAEQSSQRKMDAAHLDEESARRIPIIQGHLTNNQHVGAYAGSSTALELQKKATHYLEDIDKNTKPKTGFGTPGSSVKY